LLLLALLCAAAQRRAIAAAWIALSDFEPIESVYFAPGFDGGQRAAFLSVLADARSRVERLYGLRRGKPTIVVTDTNTRERYDDTLERELATMVELAP